MTPEGSIECEQCGPGVLVLDGPGHYRCAHCGAHVAADVLDGP